MKPRSALSQLFTEPFLVTDGAAASRFDRLLTGDFFAGDVASLNSARP